MALVGAGYRWSEGGWFKDSDGSGPYTVDSAGNAYLMSGAAQGDNVAMVANSAQQVGGQMDSTVGGPTIGTNGRFGSLFLDLCRRLITKPLGHAQSQAAGRLAALTTGAGNIIGAAGAGVRYDLHVVTVNNRDTVDCTVDILDGATVVWSLSVKAGDSQTVHFSAGFSLTQNQVIAAALRAALTTNSPEVSILAFRNKT